MLKLHEGAIQVDTPGRGFTNITDELAALVAGSGISHGLCTVFMRHTSASLVIQENADPAVLRDLDAFMRKLAPDDGAYEHDAEGPDDMPAHIRACLTSCSETIPVRGRRLGTGTWQALYLWEHRAQPHRRELFVTVLGE